MSIVLTKVGLLSVRSLIATSAHPTKHVCMVHGAGQDWWVYETWMRLFCAQGWDVHAISLRGRGDSWTMPVAQFCNLTVADYRDDILAVCDALALQAPVLLGHSLGGIAVQMAAQSLFERVRPCAAVVLVASAGPAALGTRGARYYPADQCVIRADSEARQRYFYSASPDVIEQTIARFVPESPGALNTSGGRAEVDATRIVCPVLALSGACDATDVPTAMQIATLYGGSAITLAATGHNIMQEACSEFACRCILAWLSTCL